MPKVSVLMPVYNTNETHLREAIESILSQTFRDFEFLIVNDASTLPHVDTIVRSYQDPRIQYAVNDTNIGITHTRNKLIDWASGEYLAIMDHDDISLPTRFAEQVDYLDANPAVGVVACNYEKFRYKAIPSKQKKRFINTLIDDADIRLALMRTCALIHPAAMIRKQVLIDNNIRYEHTFTPAEDYALWCRLIPYTQFHNIPKVLFRYRCHGRNTSCLQRQKSQRAASAIHAFVEQDNPLLFREFGLTAKHQNICRLFGCIPLWKTVTQAERTWVYLFTFIPLLSYKKTAS
jgi:glycosyltransferase involved in cell wall biosynthesis